MADSEESNEIQQLSPKKAKMVLAMVKHDGNITQSCKEIGLDRSTHYKWLETDEEYKRQIEEIPEMFLDEAEMILREKIREKETVSVLFFLKTQGKKRGYVERTETDNIGKAPVNLVINGLTREDTGVDDE